MASSWVKSLQCKSRAVEDVYLPNPKQHFNNIISSSTSCTKSSQGLKDVVESCRTTKTKTKAKAKAKAKKPTRRHHQYQYPTTTIIDNSNKSSSTTTIIDNSNKSSSTTTKSQPAGSNGVRTCTDPGFLFPTLTELPEGHPSRNVVEIIFHTSWSSSRCFSGRIEMLFKVHNPSKTVTWFEEYRELVKSRARQGDGGSNNINNDHDEDDDNDGARCVADGNEMMRFHCLGPTGNAGGTVYDVGGGMCLFSGKDNKDGMICTFSGSGGAHEKTTTTACNKGGRRAMLVCRVIAGRVCRRGGRRRQRRLLGDGCQVGFDSVISGENEEELHVFDSRAVLPCFLIVYKQ